MLGDDAAVEYINLRYGEAFSMAGDDNVYTIVQAEGDANDTVMEEASALDTRKSNASNWTHEVTSQLIMTRLSMESSFSQSPQQKKLWDDLAIAMVSQGYNVTAVDCHAKWKNIITTYRKNKDKAERLGESSVAWEYFRPLHAAFGQFAQDVPPPGHLRASTTPGLRSTGWSMDDFVRAASETKSGAVHNTNIIPCAPMPKPTPLSATIARSKPVHLTQNSKKSAVEESPLTWFQSALHNKAGDSKNRTELRNRRWAEYKGIEGRKMEALTLLMYAASRFQENNLFDVSRT